MHKQKNIANLSANVKSSGGDNSVKQQCKTGASKNLRHALVDDAADYV